MVKLNYDNTTGDILGFYPDDVGYSTIPEPYIEINESTHLDCINNQGLRKVDLTSLAVVECEANYGYVYVFRDGIYLYTKYQDGDTIVTERPTATNTYTSYEWGTISAVAGKRSYTITTNFVENDTLTIAGVIFTIGTDVIGADIATTATNLQTVLSSNTTINSLYTVTVSNATITLIEITAGGGNTPSESTITGTGVITNSTATTSTASSTGWKIDLATSLDALNSSYDTEKKRIHEAHSSILIALALGKITQEQADERTNVLANEYGVMWNDILAKQEVLKNG